MSNFQIKSVTFLSLAFCPKILFLPKTFFGQNNVFFCHNFFFCEGVFSSSKSLLLLLWATASVTSLALHESDSGCHSVAWNPTRLFTLLLGAIGWVFDFRGLSYNNTPERLQEQCYCVSWVNSQALDLDISKELISVFSTSCSKVREAVQTAEQASGSTVV